MIGAGLSARSSYQDHTDRKSWIGRSAMAARPLRASFGLADGQQSLPPPGLARLLHFTPGGASSQLRLFFRQPGLGPWFPAAASFRLRLALPLVSALRCSCQGAVAGSLYQIALPRVRRAHARASAHHTLAGLIAIRLRAKFGTVRIPAGLLSAVLGDLLSSSALLLFKN